MFKCPVCAEYEFEYNGDDEICGICGWQNDIVQNNDPDFWGGANDESLNEAKAEWEAKNKSGMIDNSQII